MSSMRRKIYLACALLSWIGLIYLPFVSMLLPLSGLIIIVFCFRRAWPDDWRQRTGLNLNLTAICVALGLTAFLIWVFKHYILHMSTKATVIVDFPTLVHGIKSGVVFTFIQTLAEEIILGSILLRFVRDRLPSVSDGLIAGGVGLAFALLHHLFYEFGLFQTQASLSPLALSGLFLAGTLRNFLILTFGHIGFAWALHFSWNVHMFNAQMQTKGSYLSEAERFNLLLGSWEFIGGSALAIIMIVAFRRQNEL